MVSRNEDSPVVPSVPFAAKSRPGRHFQKSADSTCLPLVLCYDVRLWLGNWQFPVRSALRRALVPLSDLSCPWAPGFKSHPWRYPDKPVRSLSLVFARFRIKKNVPPVGHADPPIMPPEPKPRRQPMTIKDLVLNQLAGSKMLFDSFYKDF